MIRRPALHASIALAAALLACADPATGPCGSAGALAGAWRYTAAQAGPTPLTREGVLELEARACPDLRGRLDVVEQGAGGDRRRLAGPIFGTQEAAAVRLHLVVDGVRVEHAAVLRGDSLAGEWTSVVDGRIVAAGTFRAARTGAP